ncbi:MAG: PDZ domain-containing protein [Anaerolineaceae bacterium]|nr:PDZ domain-containing protein [Anaerolineaceae bacterium]
MKSYRILASLVAVALLAWPASPAKADPPAEALRAALAKVQPSLVIVSFYIEADDGQRVDLRFLGTVVGKDNLVMFSSLIMSDRYPIDQYHDFQIIIPGDRELKTFDAEYLGKDAVARVAFLRVTDASAPQLPPLEFVEGARLEIGDPVVGFMNLGEPDAYKVATQMTRVQVVIDKPYTLYPVSGGLGLPGTPAVTLDGKVVGLVAMHTLNRGTNARPRPGNTQIVWPTERFIERVKNPPQGGKRVKLPWLGVGGLGPVSEDLAEFLGLGDRRGVQIGRVIAGTPAARGGMKAEDIILAIGGKDITGTEGQLVKSFQNEIRELKIGQEVEFEVFRAGKSVKLKITLGEQPKTQAEAERYKNKQFGLTVRELVLNDTVGRELPNDEKGVVVHFIEPAGWAEAGGLQVEDIVKKVQGSEITTVEDFKTIFEKEVEKKPKEIVLFVLRGFKKKETQLIRIEPRWESSDKEAGQD